MFRFFSRASGLQRAGGRAAAESSLPSPPAPPRPARPAPPPPPPRQAAMASLADLLPACLYGLKRHAGPAPDAPGASAELKPLLAPGFSAPTAALLPALAPRQPGLLIPAPAEGKKIKLYSPQFYAACTMGGILSCGLTHTAVTPLDVVKCNMQTDPARYKGIAQGFSLTMKEAGVGGLVKGWLPTLVGYSIQGAGKFGLYEFFKKCVPAHWPLHPDDFVTASRVSLMHLLLRPSIPRYYSDLAGPETAKQYQTLIYLAGSASAEFFADIGLCPLEAVKVSRANLLAFQSA